MTATHVSTANIDALCSFSLVKQDQPLRRGTWTREEEVYVAALIQEFKEGHLLVKEGTSLRSFLSKIVRCNPKRISKKFEGSNYNGKQLYEQSETQLDSAEALKRRVALQDMENKFEDSVTALQTAEDARKTGHPSSYAMGYPPSDRINLFSQQPSLFAGAGAGLSGLTNEANWLRSSLAASGGMNLGLSGLGPMARGLDPLFLAGLGASPESKALQAANEGALLDMVRMSNGMESIGDSGLLKGSLSDPSLARFLPQHLSAFAGVGSLGGVSSGLRSSLGFPSSLAGDASSALHQELLHQQLTSSAGHQSLLDEQSRRQFMDLLSRSDTSVHGKRPSALLSATDIADLAEGAKKRRLY